MESGKLGDDRFCTVNLVYKSLPVRSCLSRIIDFRLQLTHAPKAALGSRRDGQDQATFAPGNVQPRIPSFYDRIFHSNERIISQGIEIRPVAAVATDRLIEQNPFELIISQG